MGVYIKGMKMPKKQICIILNPNGLVEVLDANNILLEEYQAVPVPPHGRLIDADAVKAEIDSFIDNISYSYSYLLREEQSQMEHGMVFARDIVCDAPTIIPTEENNNDR